MRGKYKMAKEDSSYSGLAEQYSKMVAQETGFNSYSHAGSSRYIAYAPIAGRWMEYCGKC